MIVALQQELLHARARSEEKLTWAQAAPLLPGTYVELRLLSQDRLWGWVLSTSGDALKLDIHRTSNERVYPRSVTAIPSAEVSMIRQRRRRADTGAIGAGIGGTAVAPLAHGLGASEKVSNGGVLLIVAGAMALGAWVAHRFTEPALVIQIVPAPGQTP